MKGPIVRRPVQPRQSGGYNDGMINDLLGFGKPKKVQPVE